MFKNQVSPFIHLGFRLLKRRVPKGLSFSFLMKFKSPPPGPRDTFSMAIKEKADTGCLDSLKWLSTQYLTSSLLMEHSNSVFQRALCFTFHGGMKSSITSVVLQLMNLCMSSLLERCSVFLVYGQLRL